MQYEGPKNLGVKLPDLTPPENPDTICRTLRPILASYERIGRIG